MRSRVPQLRESTCAPPCRRCQLAGAASPPRLRTRSPHLDVEPLKALRSKVKARPRPSSGPRRRTTAEHPLAACSHVVVPTMPSACLQTGSSRDPADTGMIESLGQGHARHPQADGGAHHEAARVHDPGQVEGHGGGGQRHSDQGEAVAHLRGRSQSDAKKAAHRRLLNRRIRYTPSPEDEKTRLGSPTAK